MFWLLWFAGGKVLDKEGFKMVELTGLEPVAYTLRTYRSSQLSYSPIGELGMEIQSYISFIKPVRYDF